MLPVHTHDYLLHNRDNKYVASLHENVLIKYLIDIRREKREQLQFQVMHKRVILIAVITLMVL